VGLLLFQVRDPDAEVFHLVQGVGEQRHDLGELVL